MWVALVEDNPAHAELMNRWLTSGNFFTTRYALGSSLLHALRQNSFDVLVLNESLPDISGIEMLKQLRGPLQSPIPILMISAHARESAIVRALDEGADDYMPKPLNRIEFLARLRALRRRNRGRSEPLWSDVIEIGSVRIDCQIRGVWRRGDRVHLTGKDFDLAALFLRNVGRVLSRAEIHNAVWRTVPQSSSRTLDTHVSRIRHTLGLVPTNRWCLMALYGRGYRLEQRIESTSLKATHFAAANRNLIGGW
jgi:DNA-binding response OmpR family regulator